MSAATIKAYRQRLIMEVLAQHEVATQAQLLERLLERGVPTTQGAVSRDMLSLPVVQYKGRWLTVARFLALLEAEPRAEVLELVAKS